MSDNIKVAVRLRHLISREKDRDAPLYWTARNSRTICQINSSSSSYTFDRVFDGFEDNNVVYSEFCAPIVQSVIDGFNGTIFAYGQTSSGKTYTIMGNDEIPGIAYHTVMELFEQIQNMPDREFLIRVSFMEIYNEMVKDLLTPSDENLKLQEDPYGNIKVNKLTETIVQEPDQVLSLMKQGQSQRKTGETKQNDKSSRSHTIFRMIIESGLRSNVNAAVNVSHFNIVDLAGSEKTSLNTHNGTRFKEGVNINKSLFMLSQVISQLSAEKEHQFISFRDSKLTRILQNSLGGNALTAIICTVTPASLEETLSTIKFASRAKKIKNKPQVNEIETEQALLKKYANKIKRLTEELEATKEEKDQEEKKRKDMQQQIEHLKKKFVTHIAPEKNFVRRSNRRETWGGCLDKTRMKLLCPSSNIPSFSAELSKSQDLCSQRKISRRETLNSDNLSILEEETDMDLISESDDIDDGDPYRNRLSSRSTFGDQYRNRLSSRSIFDDQYRNRSSNISTFSSKLSLDVMPTECFKKDASIQANLSEHCESIAEMPSESVEIKMLEKISELEKELEFLKLEQNKSFETKIENSNKFHTTEGNSSGFKPFDERINDMKWNNHNTLQGFQNDDESFGIINHLIFEDSEVNRDVLDLNQEFFFQHLNRVIEKLKEASGIETNTPNISNPYLKVIFQLFSLSFQLHKNPCISVIKNLSGEIEDMLTILTKIFTEFNSQQTLREEYDKLFSRFTEVSDIILKEIQLSSAVETRHMPENKTSNSDNVFNSISCFDIPDVINVSFSNTPCLSKEIASAEKNEFKNGVNEKNTSLENKMELIDQHQKQISNLKEKLNTYIKTVSDLKNDCDLKEKQISLFQDKISIQEKYIASLQEELAFKNDSNDFSTKHLLNTVDNSTQTYYMLSKSQDSHFIDLNRELNDSIRNLCHNESDETKQLVENSETFLFQSTTDKSFESAKIICKNETDKDVSHQISSNSIKIKNKQSNSLSVPDTLMATVTSVLREFSDFKALVLRMMEENMQKAYLGECLELSGGQHDIWESLKIEIRALREMFKRIEFFLKDTSSDIEHFKIKADQRFEEIYLLKEQISTLELTLKEKETQLENMMESLNLFTKDIKQRISQIKCFKRSDFNEDKTLAGFSKDLTILKDVILHFEKYYYDQEAKPVPSLSVSFTQTVENYPDLAELERVRTIEFKEREDLNKENLSLKLKIEELSQAIDDLNLAIQEKDKKAIEVERLHHKEIEELISAHEIKENDWIIKLQNLEEKYEKELTNQEKELFDDMTTKFNEILKNKQSRLKEMEVYYSEKISSLEHQLTDEKDNGHQLKLKLEDEIKEFKKREEKIKESYYKLKTKFTAYIQDVKIRMNQTKNSKDVETQTDPAQKKNENSEKEWKATTECDTCHSLKKKIVELQNRVKIEPLCKSTEIESSKDLKNELCLKNSKIIALEAKKENMAKEITDLKKELLSKSALLRSCNCRLIAKPEDLIKDMLCSTKRDTLSASNESIADKAKLCDRASESPRDVLQLDVVQKAIQEARDKERAIFYRAEGPSSDMMNLYLKRQLNKKEKEISDLKNLLAKKPAIISEVKPAPEKQNVNKLGDKHPAGNSPTSEQKLRKKVHLLELKNEENFTPYIKSVNPPLPEDFLKVRPKKVLMERNKPYPTSQSINPSKPSNFLTTTDNKKENEEIENRLLKLTRDPAVPECKTQ